ncbi:WxcM-like domain-containing protein [Kistimonas asteriae]|uniref:WxcM-like domain-containing protein n=1 Tax=Kistimonas asteriae TaxID=517724 RepID=UPI001BABD8A1|nr:WxcM-like domain-containing protein [Kistimonas asteriae]
MDGLIITPLKEITHSKGNIYHAMKKSDNGFAGFGEAYFSSIKTGAIKGWKKHNEMTLNLIVPIGEVEFVLYNGIEFERIVLSPKNYFRLTVSPSIWVAFRGLSPRDSIILNIANIEHDPHESETRELNDIPYMW